MSTEVDTKHAADTEPAARPANTSTPRPDQPAAWRRRRYQVIAGALAIALIVVFVANNVLARQYSPSGAVSQYLTAIQSGDAAAAWSLIQVSAPTTNVDATLIDRASLQAALGSAKPDIRSFAVTQTANADANVVAVVFSYETAGGTKRSTFTV